MTEKESTKPRRVFMMRVLAISTAMAAAQREALAAEHLDPSDPYAKSMGFRLNTAEVDQNRYPRHTLDQHCQFCQLWNGGDKDFGNCSFFDGAITPKMGWCRNFKAKKKP